MSTVFAHYEHHRDVEFEVTDSYGDDTVCVKAETCNGGLNVGLFMSEDQLRLLVVAIADHLLALKKEDKEDE